MNYLESLNALISNLNYCKETGVFTWMNSPANCVKAGSVAGARNTNGYLQISYKRKKFFAHRLAWFIFYKEFPKNQIDHINGIKHDNRICNLRDVTYSMNQQNTKIRSDNKSGKKGVSWNEKSRKWQSMIGINGRLIYLGMYDDIELAYAAYKEKAKEHHQINSVFSEGRL